MGNIDIQRYMPPGPIGAAFIKSRGPIDTIMGPGGSGKTVCSVIKGPMHAAEYMPVCKDGWVRVKTLCVRDTYRSFARTALASWYNTFPEKHPWTVSHEGGQDRPVVHTLCWEAWRGADKVKIEYTMETGAIGDNDLEAFAKGYEISLAWGNEYDLMPENTLPVFFQRCGRFPPVEMIAPSELERVSRDGRQAMRLMGLTVDDSEPVLPRIVWGDMNPPDIDHPAYTTPYGEVSKPGGVYSNVTPGWNGFWQPGGLSPHAENRVGKPRSSYELEAATTKDKRLVRRMVHSLPAYAKDGTPVYEDYFNPDVHKADQAITPIPQLGLTIGIDAGGSPAATFGQISPSGQNRCLAELVADPGTGPTRFGQMMISLLMNRFPNIPIIGAWADPSAWYGADTQTGEFHWINTLAAIVRFPIMPAPSNEPSIRQEAVKHYLSLTIDNVTPGYIVDPSCKWIIGGYEAHYKFSKKTSSSETDKGEAVKNGHSHPHDAEQYRCLGQLGLAALVSKAVETTAPQNVIGDTAGHRRGRQVEARQRPGDFNVWDV
ncbi:hypothetical protein KGO5_01737 [Sinorhizobium sp. KGO-5]|uniref:hypothetical protein n=1 Tax=Sinorhizobium sp. KGO-5 TaxID=1470810 RepID=UPI00294912D2|nr:hypothetical protein KGO5_01737 [Sinorhizobium sp. KGO-5]